LEEHANRIRDLAQHYKLPNVRVFGSTIRGEDPFASDVDLLVTPSEETCLLTLAAFQAVVEQLIGFPVDVVVDSRSGSTLLTEIRKVAQPL
jgi:uncharacterized protein